MFRLSDDQLQEAVTTLQDLLRIDTTNPPGNELPAAQYLAAQLDKEGIDYQMVSKTPGRPCLVARLPGSGKRRPLMLSSHLDVVPADPNRWTHPPFSGARADGCIWGRGAIDMKGMTAMGLTVLRLLKRSGALLHRDLILAAVADEEAGCEFGSAFLVEQHPGLIDAEYVINEVGGFSLEMGGKKFYPIQVAEKGIAWLRITVRGQPGHGSLPKPDSCLASVGRALQILTQSRLPFHPTSPALDFLKAVSSEIDFPQKAALSALRFPLLAGVVLDRLIGDPMVRATLQAILCNTVNPTLVQAGTKINVVPSSAEIGVDGRTLPGQTAQDLTREVRSLLGPEFQIEVVQEAPATVFSPDSDLFRTMTQVLLEHDPSGLPVPYLVSGFTDSSKYAQLGAVCYGFYPLDLPPGLQFAQMFHGDDERIPISSYRFGIETLYDLVKRFCGAESHGA